MTDYYTKRDDFSQGKRTGFGEDNHSEVHRLLDGIDQAAKAVSDNGLEDLYEQVGVASFGKHMAFDDFMQSMKRAESILEAMKKVHREIVQNIESQFLEELTTAIKRLDYINEGDHTYTSEHLKTTKTVTRTAYSPYSGPVEYQTKETVYYHLSDLITSEKSPVPAARDLYQLHLKEAKANLIVLEKKDRKTAEKLQKLSEQELMEAFYPTSIGEYQVAKTSFADRNPWLGWMENGSQIAGVTLMLTGAFTANPLLVAAGGGILSVESGYRFVTGESMSGEILTDSERTWAGVETVSNVLTSGSLSVGAVVKTGQVANTAKIVGYAADGLDTIQFAHEFQEDPAMATAGLVGSHMVGRGIADLGIRYRSGDLLQGAKAFKSAPEMAESLQKRYNGLKESIQSGLNKVETSPQMERLRALMCGGEPAYAGIPRAQVTPESEGTVQKLVSSIDQEGKTLRKDIQAFEGSAPLQGDQKGMTAAEQRSRVLKNIEESRKAREASNFDNYLREEYHAQGKYFPERVDLPNGKRGYLSDETFDGKPVPVRAREFVDAEGHIKWPEADGFVTDSAGNPITEPANLKAGQVIDRYGGNGGRFTSPVENGQKLAYDTRGLPYPEGYQPYHQYEVVKDITKENIVKSYNQSPKIIQDKVSVEMKKWNLSFDDLANVRKGEIAKVFGQGGGTQIQFGTSVSVYELLGLLKEVV